MLYRLTEVRSDSDWMERHGTKTAYVEIGNGSDI